MTIQVRTRIIFFWGIVLLLVLCLLSLMSGRYALGMGDIVRVFLGHGSGTTLAVLLHSRLPRLIAAIGVGAALSVSGVGFQAVFRNPLVSPDLLGVLSGAAFGAAVAILFHANPVGIQIASFAGGSCAVGFGVLAARLVGLEGILPLLLGGVISASFFTALVSFLKYMADPYDELPAIIYWLLGSLAQVSWFQLAVILPLLTIILAGFWAASRILDTLDLSDDEARSLGLNISLLRCLVLLGATALGALTVSLAGMIGWIGLIMPHVARLLVGPRHAVLLPCAALLGALCLALADLAARSVSVSELPLGMMTELFGALTFTIVLRRLRVAGRL